MEGTRRDVWRENPLHFACSYSFMQESKQLQSIAVAAEVEAKGGRVDPSHRATEWARAPLWGEARQWLLRKETATI